MEINYILIYGNPYLQTKYFEKFDDISDYLVKKRIVNYKIFEKMQDNKEIEMIQLNNNVEVLENKINNAIKEIKSYDKNCFAYSEYLEPILKVLEN